MFNGIIQAILVAFERKTSRACAGITLVNVNAPVVATTSWWWHFYALVMALKVKKSIPVDFMIYL